MDNSTHDMSEMLLRYLDGELEDHEKSQLEQKLATDPALQEELNNLRLAKESIRSYGLAGRVGKIHKEMMNEIPHSTPVIQISRRRQIIRYSIAVAAALLILFVGFKMFQDNNMTADQLYADNYKAYELTTLRSGETEPTIFEKAYRDKNYNEVITLYSSANPDDIQANFLTAMSHLELKEYDKAIENFKKNLELNKAAGTHLWQDQSEYYMALAYLKTENYSSSLELFQKINNDTEHLYHEKVSSKLLKQVKRLNNK